MVSIGYSALSSSLMVTGEANFRVREDVRITGIKVLSFENEGYETYTAEYYKDGTKVMVTLPKTDSKVTYEVEIKNTSEETYQLKEIKDEIASNPEMKYEINGLNLDDIIGPGETKTFQIVVSYQDETSEVPSEITATFEIRYVFEVVQVIPPPTGTNFVDYLKSIANPDTITTYADENGNQQEMYTFKHEKTGQTDALTDYRYIGDHPNNYVYFNCTDDGDVSTCEKWRIVGVFKADSKKGPEDRVKIIRDTSIGKMAWNSNSGNNWETATLNTYLNETYYDGLSETAKLMIVDTKYYLGGHSYDTISGSEYYQKERGTITYQSNPTFWMGKIGLMYLSDYLYTYALGVDDTCYRNGVNCGYMGTYGMPSAGWLYNGKNQCTLFTRSNSTYVYHFIESGMLQTSSAGGRYDIRPTVYLASDILKRSGTGSLDDPYVICSPEMPLDSAATKLKLEANTSELFYTRSTSEQKQQMYTFKHEATEQTGALTDYRYIGNTPNNYVYFNCKDDNDTATCEKWRIIGVFPVDDGTGKIEERIKIIKNSSIGARIWDSSGVNNWETASLNQDLNETYYNGLSETAKAMIGDTKYYLGGSSKDSGLAGPDYYKFERGTAVYDSSRPTYWVGKIALMYPSDYVYTYALGVNDTCYTNAYICNQGTPSSGWLFVESDEWTLTPILDEANRALRHRYTGYVSSYDTVVSSYNVVRPTLYLSSRVSIVDGDGSSGNPYQLAIE